MNTKKTAAQIEEDEGIRLKAYLDTEGILTIGVGHNCISSPVPGVTKVGDRITQENADRLFIKDLATATRETTNNFSWFLDLNDARQAVLVNMVFNMGVGKVRKFKKALAAMEQGDWNKAAIEMIDSKWAIQTGRRAQRLSEQMRTGEWTAHKGSK